VGDGPVIRSYSQLTSYFQCAWFYKLRRIDRLPESPSVWNFGGTAFHAATEAFDRKWFDLERAHGRRLAQLSENDRQLEIQWAANLFEIEFDLLVEKARENDPDLSTWRVAGVGRLKSMPDGEDATWWRRVGRDFVGAYIDWRVSNDDALTLAAVESGPAVELEARTQIIEGVELLAFVDRVFTDRKTGVNLVFDLKSGRNPPKDNSQLGLYSVLLDMIGLPTTWGAYYLARKGEMQEVVRLDGYTWSAERQKFLRLEANIQAGNFPPNPTVLCGYCSLRDHCEFKKE
jgi:putative RecB family exonuclease